VSLKEATHVKTSLFPISKLKKHKGYFSTPLAKVWQQLHGEVSINSGNISQRSINDHPGGTQHDPWARENVNRGQTG
jgi:hypothetical protein